MGGDAGPSVIVDGALVAARHLQVGLLLVGDAAAIEAELARHPVASLFRRIDVRIIHAPDYIGMSESPALALRRKPRASIKVAADAVRDGAGRRALQRRPHRRLGHGRACSLRAAAGRRSSGSRHHHSDAALARRAPRRRRDCRLSSASPRAVRGDGIRVRERRARAAGAARRSAVRRGRGEQRQRSHARGPPAAEGCADQFHRQRGRPRRLFRGSRRDRLRWFHGQCDAEGERRTGRNRRGAVARRARGDFRRPRRLRALTPGVPAVPAPGRLLRVRRRAARRPQRSLHRRPRPILGESGRQRRHHGGASRE